MRHPNRPISGLPVGGWGGSGSSLELQRLFLDLRARARKTALFVTHDIREALRMGSRVALLHEGVMERIQPPAEFRLADSPGARAFLAGLEEDVHA